ncbi:hypothetical protein DdX_12540 [Ditylenchus destructor]|uniref:Hormone-sensitive lipase N-terminal domain-containing protein n=1 Tax=Ditylenchus destructor TaxID=166010 RepID=A0AAD4MXG2_9BILA|nr:hypothetical protein DdX_12540 [Ditylenchus destructor]
MRMDPESDVRFAFSTIENSRRRRDKKWGRKWSGMAKTARVRPTVIRETDIEFCRGFWNLSELPDVKHFCPSLAVCEKSEIPLVGAIAIDSSGQDLIYISPPNAHGISEPIPIKILDVAMRKAEQKPNLPIKDQLSPNLVTHCHGGG